MVRGPGTSVITFLSLASSFGCGRYGFDDRSLLDAGVSDDAGGDAGGGPASWVQAFVGTGQSSFASTFSMTPTRVGDALVVQAYCGSSEVPTDVSIGAPGWTFLRVSSIVGGSTVKDWAASFVAIAPTTLQTTFTATWSLTACDFGLGTIGDEFMATSGVLGDLVVDHAEAFGLGDCVTALANAQAGDVLWGACTGNVTATGASFVKGADDSGGDWTEYEIATVAVPTEQVTFANPTGQNYVITAITLRHR